ncbi:hypothetical protein [Mycobacterium sp. E740]|uniref:hypothetical protein n=1 Tax=Mycobacterium sp. E740 TaxID=1834149 RepID=UPI000800567E|nr:hypothetical protein [Mycobacterium sp. E740]OBI81916.1 hypothetical protein A5663_15535 [Mycobacterium sp. E740]
MVDRFLVWLSAGVVTAGMCTALLAGAGVSIADDGASTDSGGSKTSESSNSTDTTKDSPGTRVSGVTGSGVTGTGRTDTSREKSDPDDTDAKKRGKKDAEEGAGDGRRTGATKDEPTGTTKDELTEIDPAVTETDPEVTEIDPEVTEIVDSADEEAAKGDVTEGTSAGEDVVKHTRSYRERSARQTSAVATQHLTTAADVDTATRAESERSSSLEVDPPTAVVDPVAQEHATITLNKVVDTEEPEVQAVAFVSTPLAATATATAPQIPGIIRVIGTIIFDLYAVATRLLGGPPILPANSTVTVRSSSLRIDCACGDGEGVDVPVDWYVPKTEEGKPPPDRLIYLQHGFLASGPWYSHTAAALAERTNSIVVAPSITSNFLAADACWLGGAPMHEAMAGLFDDDNTALADSARAAGYAGPIPYRVVLMGHSLGGGAVSGMAGYMADDERIDRLAGVVLLDGVALGDPARMTASLKKVPLDIPIYQLAAPVYMWNNFGAGQQAMVAARPDQFVGVTLVNGSHVDSMRGGNPLIQFAQELVAGFSRPENAAAAQLLMVGWVNDMFAGDRATGIYLQPGEEFSFGTPAGEASVVALPNTLTKPFWLNFLRPFMSLADGFFTLDPVCVAESVGTSHVGACSDSIAA